MLSKDKAASPTEILSEVIIADEDCGVEWLTSLCNLAVARGRIPDPDDQMLREWIVVHTERYNYWNMQRK